MELDQLLAGRTLERQRDLLVLLIYELTVQARGQEDGTKFRGIIEAIHTLAGALLPGPYKDLNVGDILRDFGRIYGIDEVLSRAFERVGGAKAIQYPV